MAARALIDCPNLPLNATLSRSSKPKAIFHDFVGLVMILYANLTRPKKPPTARIGSRRIRYNLERVDCFKASWL